MCDHRQAFGCNGCTYLRGDSTCGDHEHAARNFETYHQNRGDNHQGRLCSDSDREFKNCEREDETIDRGRSIGYQAGSNAHQTARYYAAQVTREGGLTKTAPEAPVTEG